MTRRRTYWIADVLISPRVEEKLLVKHGVRRDEVEDAVRFGAYRDARWHTTSGTVNVSSSGVRLARTLS
jgi:hypothetical protein